MYEEIRGFRKSLRKKTDSGKKKHEKTYSEGPHGH